jgi:1-acyl-sn-glycerol-3-phosphate acyltransferase
MTQNIEETLAFVPPAREEVAKANRLKKWYFDPVFEGLENISPDRPTLLVGNHSRFAGLEMQLFYDTIYAERGVFVRGLSDRMHYKIPVWRDVLTAAGAVLGSRDMCSAMMEAGHTLLVYPGGGREVTKGRGTNYKLLWEGRTGFVRMAIKHGYTITPFCSVGPDDAFDVLFDTDGFVREYFGDWLKEKGLDKKLLHGGVIPPIPRGVGLSMLPRPEKFYFKIGKPIETKKYSGKHEDKKLLQQLQRKTADTIYGMCKNSMLQREHEAGEQPLWRRVLRSL